jgi:starch phosphorylase
LLPAGPDRANWNQRVQQVWDKVGFVEIGPGPEVSVLAGVPIPVRAVVNLAGLSPGDVRVEGCGGTHWRQREPGGNSGNDASGGGADRQRIVFLKEFVPHQTGRLGYSLRISPNHYDDPLTRPCNSLLKWSGE